MLKKCKWETTELEANTNRITISGKYFTHTYTDIQYIIYSYSFFLSKNNDKSRRDEDLYNNRRIATWLGYLTDVEKGGGTAFINANITVFPVKGTIILILFSKFKNFQNSPFVSYMG